MVIQSGIFVNRLRARSPRPIHLQKIFRSGNALFSSMSTSVDEDHNDFLQWLERKAGTNISSTLSIGKSPYGGMGAFASENIKKGDCILKIPFSVQLGCKMIPQEIRSILLATNIDPVSEIAVLFLLEKNRGQHSEWDRYISRLPLPHHMHSPVFWSDKELQMIQPSWVYQQTLRRRNLIEMDFLALKPVFDQFPSCFQNITLDEFKYAFQMVKSRAWKNRRGLSLIPFGDFMNHDPYSSSVFVDDEDQRHTVVLADRDYAAGNEVVVRYGDFANSTLLLDYGFTISGINPHDFVYVKLGSIGRHQMLGFVKVNMVVGDLCWKLV